MRESLILLSFICVSSCYAQTDTSFDEFRKNTLNGMSNYRDSIKTEFQNFRRKINADYADFLRGVWKNEKSLPSPPPIEEPVPTPPIIISEEDKNKPIKDKPVVIEEELPPTPTPKPQPQPVVPIEETPAPPIYHEFAFYGANIKVRLSPSQKFRLSSVQPSTMGNAWDRLSEDDFTNLIYDCLNIRKNLHLCDWAYLQMVGSLSEHFFGGRCNEATFLTAYIFCQSGYRIRLGVAADKLYLLVGTPHQLITHGYFKIDGLNYFVYNENPESLNICDAEFKGEQMLSLYIPQLPNLPNSLSEKRILKSERYPDIVVASQINKNLIAFYNKYPTSVIGENICTRWAMYAETPLCTPAETHVVNVLKEKLKGHDESVALNKLLNFVQTAFVYEYDDKVWGGDRAFFGDETLFYPYCDCEDRSIFFSRLVREILGLKVLLVFYPGHLATAVCPRTNMSGDYIILGGNKYIICDPTYIGAPAGLTMPDMDNKSAKVILLK